MPSPWILLVIAGVLLLLYGIFAPERVQLEGFRGRVVTAPSEAAKSQPVPVAGNHATVTIAPDEHDIELVALPQIDDDALQRIEPEAVASAAPQWPLLFDANAVDVTPAARKNIVVALGALSESWCAPIIAAAFTDDPVAEVRAAALAALRDGRYESELETLRSAMRSTHDSERVLAIEALGAVRAYPAIEDALEDPSFGVAAAAAYQLVRGYGNDRAQTLLRERASDERTSHVADLLAIFT